MDERAEKGLARSAERQIDVDRLFSCVTAGESCSVVGLSNMGKSALLRLTYARGLAEQANARFFYVDCNRMLTMTDQGFYELILRCMLDDLRRDLNAGPAANQIAASYQKVTAAANSFQVSLGFSEGMTTLIEGSDRSIVLLMDEFDQPLRALDGRVLLNLRALSDRYPGRLCYVVATNQPLREIRCDPDVDEFCELFEHHVVYLSPLSEGATRDYVLYLAQHNGVTFDEQDIEFVQKKAGGHPGLVEAICDVLGAVTGKPLRDSTQNWIIHRDVSERLRTDGAVQNECVKLWNELTPEEQEGLVSLMSPQGAPPTEILESLEHKQLVCRNGDGYRFFGEVFEDFVRRQRVVRRGTKRHIRLDVESGEIWVDGKLIPTLTQLEHRLIMLLYGRLGKLVDKYEVVESVWGEGYIDEVDDARIEKLISRLRQKIEPDPANPRYLITLRGRGYKMIDE
jgi:hypothetical protein